MKNPRTAMDHLNERARTTLQGLERFPVTESPTMVLQDDILDVFYKNMAPNVQVWLNHVSEEDYKKLFENIAELIRAVSPIPQTKKGN